MPRQVRAAPTLPRYPIVGVLQLITMHGRPSEVMGR